MSIKDFARIEFLKNTTGFTNYAGNIVKVVQETDTEVYYFDSFKRYCYLPKSEEGVSYRYIPKGVRANKRLHSDKCPRCNGRKKVRSTSNTDVVCPLCNGTGIYR